LKIESPYNCTISTLSNCNVHIILFFFSVQEVEKDVKARTKGDLGAAKTLCTPFDQPELPEGMLILLLRFSWTNSCSFCFPIMQLLTCVACPNSGTLCFASGKPAKKWSFWGRSYWLVFHDMAARLEFWTESCSIGRGSENPFTLCFYNQSL